jgi:hypothetical protein
MLDTECWILDADRLRLLLDPDGWLAHQSQLRRAGRQNRR